jgi:hypothetical protein
MFNSFRKDLKELADEDLMELVRERDARAFEVVFERHGGLAAPGPGTAG